MPMRSSQEQRCGADSGRTVKDLAVKPHSIADESSMLLWSIAVRHKDI